MTQFRNPDVLLTLAQVYAAVGRPAEVEATLAQALEAAQAQDPQLLSEVRLRAEEIRARRGEVRSP